MVLEFLRTGDGVFPPLGFDIGLLRKGAWNRRLYRYLDKDLNLIADLRSPSANKLLRIVGVFDQITIDIIDDDNFSAVNVGYFALISLGHA